MAEFQEVAGRVEIPKNVGVEGFLHAIRDILKLPRVQRVTIDSRGRVEYMHYVREGEPHATLDVDFETLLPSQVIRNSKVSELGDPDLNAAVALGQLFNMASRDQLFPVALVVGADTRFWAWYEATTTIEPASYEELYGIPVRPDRQIEDYVVVLCAAFAREAELIDTQRSYKLVIPQV